MSGTNEVANDYSFIKASYTGISTHTVESNRGPTASHQKIKYFLYTDQFKSYIVCVYQQNKLTCTPVGGVPKRTSICPTGCSVAQ